MPYQPGPWYTAMIQRRQEEKRADRELKDYFVKMEYQKQLQDAQNRWHDLDTTFRLVSQAYNSAATPAQKEAIVQRGLQMREQFAKDAPILGQALDTILKGSPLEQRELAKRDWLKVNPIPPEPSVLPDENPQLYATQYWNRQKAIRQYHKDIDGVDYVMPSYVSVGKDQISMLDQHGNPYLTSWEIANKHLDEIGQAVGVNGQYLLQSGGWLPPQIREASIIDEDGNPRQVAVSIQWNAMSNTIKKEILDVGSGRPIGRGKAATDGFSKIVERSLPKDEVYNALAYLEDNKMASKDKNPVTKLIYEEATEIMDRHSKDPQRMEYELNRFLQSKDPRFTYVTVNSDEMKRFGTNIWGSKLKFGEGSYIIPVPGKLSYVDTADGVPVPVIVDDRREKGTSVYSDKGTFLGGMEAIERIASRTAAENEIELPKRPKKVESVKEEKKNEKPKLIQRGQKYFKETSDGLIEASTEEIKASQYDIFTQQLENLETVSRGGPMTVGPKPVYRGY